MGLVKRVRELIGWDSPIPDSANLLIDVLSQSKANKITVAQLIEKVAENIGADSSKDISVLSGTAGVGPAVPSAVNNIDPSIRGSYHIALIRISSTIVQCWQYNSVSWFKHWDLDLSGGGGSSSSPQSLINSVKLNYLHGREDNIDAHDGNESWIRNTLVQSNIHSNSPPYLTEDIPCRVYLLKIFISNWDEISQYSPRIFFDRYKRKRRVKEKHWNLPEPNGTISDFTTRQNASKFMRATEVHAIPLTGASQLIDFNPEVRFLSSTYGFPVQQGLGKKSAKGTVWAYNESVVQDAGNNPNGYRGGTGQSISSMYYRPRIEITVDGQKYESIIDQTIKVKATKYSDEINGTGYNGSVSYEFT